jgi:hypothetical protein
MLLNLVSLSILTVMPRAIVLGVHSSEYELIKVAAAVHPGPNRFHNAIILLASLTGFLHYGELK